LNKERVLTKSGPQNAKKNQKKQDAALGEKGRKKRGGKRPGKARPSDKGGETYGGQPAQKKTQGTEPVATKGRPKKGQTPQKTKKKLDEHHQEKDDHENHPPRPCFEVSKNKMQKPRPPAQKKKGKKKGGFPGSEAQPESGKRKRKDQSSRSRVGRVESKKGKKPEKHNPPNRGPPQEKRAQREKKPRPPVVVITASQAKGGDPWRRKNPDRARDEENILHKQTQGRSKSGENQTGEQGIKGSHPPRWA